MFHVAVYNNQQHEQFRCSAEQFALREAISGRWVPVWVNEWDSEPENDAQHDAGLLRFSVSAGTVRFEDVPSGWRLADGDSPQSGCTQPCPCLLQNGETWLEVAMHDESRNLVPLVESSFDALFVTQPTDEPHAGPATSTVTRWLTEVGQLHRASAGSAEFYADAARFAVEPVGLDASWVLRRQDDRADDDWQIVGSQIAEPDEGIGFDAATLERVGTQQGTWFEPANNDQDNADSTSQAIVIAPVHDEEGQLVAAIYGSRNTDGVNRRRGVRPLEARLVQLLADSVAVGIARMHRETEATRTRVLLEHAFSPTVAEHIQQHPECLAGQERDVTLLFADLCGYSSLAETMPLADCYELLSDVMESLTQVVVAHRGVVVDYYGDGLLALWNAPLEQANHADLACGAAVEMFEALPVIAEKWQSRLSGPLELGIGIHSGPAYVGNAGSRSRLKYGPRGNTVNVASRVQAATKQLELPLVITAATQAKLSGKFFTLRVCTAKLPGLERPAELYTAYPASDAAQVKSRLEDYSRALADFEAGNLEAAQARLAKLTALGQATPAHFLAHYTAAMRVSNQGRRAVDKHASEQGPVIEIHAK